MPKVSVIIPAFNQARFLREAVDSVLRQSFRDFEIVIVDDGSTDDTSRVAQSFADERVKYVHQENRGLSGARDTGISLSTGEFVAFLDSDDILRQGGLEARVHALDEWPNVGLIAGGHQCVDEQGRLLREVEPWGKRPTIDLESILLAGLAPPSAVMLRRGWLERVGGFDHELRFAEDMDLWYRLSLAGCEMAWVPAMVCQYRIHGQNMCRSVREHYDAFVAALDKFFGSPGLPPSLRLRKGEVMAGKRLAEAGELYGAGDLEGGRQAMESALRLHPALLAGDQQSLIVQMVAWEESIWIDEAERVLDRAVAYLPMELAGLPGFAARLQRTRDEAGFYRAYGMGDGRRVRKLWMTLARGDAAWLFNRGNWSILLQSIG